MPNKNIKDALAVLNINTENEEVNQFVESMREDVFELMKSQQKIQRGDYNEFVELCMVYLQKKTEQNPAVSFHRPGAMHKARWMAKLIYSIKICLLE